MTLDVGPAYAQSLRNFDCPSDSQVDLTTQLPDFLSSQSPGGKEQGCCSLFPNISTIVFFGHLSTLEVNHNCFRAKKVDNGFLVCVSMLHDDLYNI